jgi:branched-chain amino acid transport system permease protein
MDVLLQLILSGLLAGGIYGLISVGLTLIFGVLNMVNFAHGEFLMIAMYTAFWAVTILGLDPYITAPIVILSMFLFALLIQRIVIKPVVESPHTVQIVVTLGMATMFQNLALMLWSGNYRTIRPAYANYVIHFGTLNISLTRLIAFLVAISSTALLYWYVRHSYFGKAIRATAQDIKAAKLVGINVDRVFSLTFGIGIGLVGLAGVVLLPLYPVYPMVGWNFVNIAFVSVVLGGLGSLPGAMAGGITVGLVEALAGFYLGSEFQQASYFAIFIILLLIRPSGYFKQ